MLINTLIAYGAFQALFIAIILFTGTNKTLFKKLFASLLIIESITLIERLLVETGFITQVPHILGISYPISFIKPPLLFFMAIALTVAGTSLAKRMYWHLLPFVLMLLANLPFYRMSGIEKMETVQLFMDRIPTYQDFTFYFNIGLFAYLGIYLVLSIKILQRYKREVTNNILVNWYAIILIAYGVLNAVHLLYFLVQPLYKLSFGIANQISMLLMAFVIQGVAFKLMSKSDFFKTRTPVLGNLAERQAQEKQLVEKLEVDKVFMDDTLTLSKFADLVGVPQKEISTIVHQKFDLSFKKWINQYRIEEAKRLMKASTKNVKLIDIAFEVGFNNKVSFYRSFKEFEGVSPSVYLQSVKNQ